MDSHQKAERQEAENEHQSIVQNSFHRIGKLEK
jgi:hypothetical protein